MELEEARKYAPVLQRMIELCGNRDHMRFGDAMRQAAKELQIQIPPHAAEALLTTMFKIFSAGKIPGQAEA